MLFCISIGRFIVILYVSTMNFIVFIVVSNTTRKLYFSEKTTQHSFFYCTCFSISLFTIASIFKFNKEKRSIKSYYSYKSFVWKYKTIYNHNAKKGLFLKTRFKNIKYLFKIEISYKFANIILFYCVCLLQLTLHLRYFLFSI